jgi:hypothetical protein
LFSKVIIPPLTTTNVLVDEFPMPYRSQWIKFNVNQTGFYRVLYETDLWNSILNVLLTNPAVFTPTDRANLIDDSFALSKYHNILIDKKTKCWSILKGYSCPQGWIY